MRHAFIIPVALLSTLVIAALVILIHTRLSNDQTNSSVLVKQSTLRALPHKSASSADTSHLAAGLVPPTNMWLSGMVLQATPQPVYPMPLSFLAQKDGFQLGLPDVSSTPTQISGSHTPGMQVSLSADAFTLTRYDKLSATLTYTKSGHQVGAVTVTEGSPFVFYVAYTEQIIQAPNISVVHAQQNGDHYVRFMQNGVQYAVSTTGATIKMTGTVLTITAHPGDLITAYALPGTTDSLRQYAANRVESVSIGHYIEGSTTTTTLSYTTANHKPTAVALLPYENPKDTGKSIGDYTSIWGDMPIYSGTSFETTSSFVQPTNELELSKLSQAEKNDIIATLPHDVAATKIDAQDSYYAGKQLARAANLLSIAEQVGQTTSAKKLITILSDAFTTRLHAQYFYYDTKLKGVAATQAAFGSEDFNDHHFHYGYWLYAGSILAHYDNSFVQKNGDQLNLLAADIASPVATSQFPAYRNYDPYAGHSWAAGLAPFSDGNNQESSSEAINAWNGVALWGKAIKNTTLEQLGEWMLANESNTASRAWRQVDTSTAALKNYTSPVASLNFGGKRTYNTFFSDTPSAKLGIQLIPMEPGMQGFRSDGSHIQISIDKTISSDNYNVPLGDYILMYLSLTNPQKAKQLLSHQTVIDNGNSLSYLKAFIYTQ